MIRTKKFEKIPAKKISTSQISIPQTTHRKPISLMAVESVYIAKIVVQVAVPTSKGIGL